MEENEEKCYTVYMHTSPSGKRYIGITSMKPTERWRNGGGYVHNDYFYKAIKKYGWDNIKHEILFTNLTKDEAEQKEIELISFYNSDNRDCGYNIDHGGHCPGRMAEETKVKIGKAHKGKHLSDETKAKISKAHKGKKLSPGHVEKIRENSRIAFNNGLCKIMADINSIKITQYTKDGKFVANWDSIAIAERETGICDSSIQQCCSGNRKKAGGYIWRYFGELLTNEHIEWCNEIKRPALYASVDQYSMDGELLNTYESVKSAASSIQGVSASSIYACCKKDIRHSAGYIFRYHDNKLTNDELKWCNELASDKRKKKIVQYTLDGKFVRFFDSAIDAKHITGIDNSGILKCCKGNQGHAGGYIWRYANE